MKLLLKKAKVLQAQSNHHGQVVDILIKDGIISKIGTDINDNDALVITSEDLHVSSGWVDIGTHIGEPGYEHREDIQSVTETAANGGFTTLLPFPNTSPVVDNRTQVERINYKSEKNLVALLPIGCVSQHNEGVDLAELFDMHQAGCIAYSDGDQSITDSGLILRALEYVKAFDGIIVQRSMDASLSKDGQMHEGVSSTSLGLPGIPSMAEFNSLERDLKLREYTEGRLMLHMISAQESVNKLTSEKKLTDKLYSTVAFSNLIHTESDLLQFDSNLKLMPPLRTEADKKALIAGINSGIIDVICSNHTPLEEERKKLEFPYADFGATGLETCFAATNTNLANQIKLETLIDCLSYNQRKIFNIKTPSIQEGEIADITLFDPKKSWTYRSSSSKSKNNAYFNCEFIGQVIGIVNNCQYQLNSIT